MREYVFENYEEKDNLNILRGLVDIYKKNIISELQKSKQILIYKPKYSNDELAKMLFEGLKNKKPQYERIVNNAIIAFLQTVNKEYNNLISIGKDKFESFYAVYRIPEHKKLRKLFKLLDFYGDFMGFFESSEYEKVELEIEKLEQESEANRIKAEKAEESAREEVKTELEEYKKQLNQVNKELKSEKKKVESLSEQMLAVIGEKEKLEAENKRIVADKEKDVKEIKSQYEKEIRKIEHEKNKEFHQFENERNKWIEERRTIELEKEVANQDLVKLHQENSELSKRLQEAIQNIATLKEKISDLVIAENLSNNGFVHIEEARKYEENGDFTNYEDTIELLLQNWKNLGLGAKDIKIFANILLQGIANEKGLIMPRDNVTGIIGAATVLLYAETPLVLYVDKEISAEEYFSILNKRDAKVVILKGLLGNFNENIIFSLKEMCPDKIFILTYDSIYQVKYINQEILKEHILLDYKFYKTDGQIEEWLNVISSGYSFINKMPGLTIDNDELKEELDAFSKHYFRNDYYEWRKAVLASERSLKFLIKHECGSVLQLLGCLDKADEIGDVFAEVLDEE